MEKKEITRQDKCQDCPSRNKGIFCDLDRVHTEELNKRKVPNIFKKGQSLFVQDAPHFGIFCVGEGNIKVSKSDQDGKSSIVRLATGGDILGHWDLFSELGHTASATALEDTTVCFIDKQYIQKLLKEQPAVAMQLLGQMGDDLKESDSKVASFCQKSTLERTCELLLQLDRTHGVSDHRGRVIDITLSREDMAGMVGTATETLIRIFSDLRREDIVQQDKKTIIIVNRGKLEALAGGHNEA